MSDLIPNLRLGVFLDTGSGSAQPSAGIQVPISKHVAISLYGMGDPRDRYLGAQIRPELVFNFNRNIHGSLFVGGNAGYFLNGTRARGGTEGAGINFDMGAEVCANVLGNNSICTALIYDNNWIEQSVLRSRSSVGDDGWFYRNLLLLQVSLSYSLE